MYSVSVLDTERADTHTPLMPNMLGHYRGCDAAEAEAAGGGVHGQHRGRGGLGESVAGFYRAEGVTRQPSHSSSDEGPGVDVHLHFNQKDGGEVVLIRVEVNHSQVCAGNFYSSIW